MGHQTGSVGQTGPVGHLTGSMGHQTCSVGQTGSISHLTGSVGQTGCWLPVDHHTERMVASSILVRVQVLTLSELSSQSSDERRDMFHAVAAL